MPLEVDPFAGGKIIKSAFDLENYLLAKLNRNENLLEEDYDAQVVSSGFVSSKVFFLHNGPRMKSVATALHIPDKLTGEIHHYDIKIVQFERKDNKTPWKLKGQCTNLTAEQVVKLKDFIDQQDQFVGKKPLRKYFKTFAANSPEALTDFSLKVEAILKNPFVDFSKVTEGDALQLTELLNKVLSGGHVVVEGKIYQQLLATRTSAEKVELYKLELQEFKKLLNDQDATETIMQNFLEDKVWFFGLNYIQTHRRSIPKFGSGLGTQYDFLLEGFNQVYDIVELKGPNESLLVPENISERGRSFDPRVDFMFSAKFSRALHQVISYLDEFESQFPHIKTQQPSIKDFIYPKGTIVISKRALFPPNGKDSVKYLHLTNRQFNNIDILTYDDLAERAEIIINFIDSLKVKTPH